MSRSFVCAAIAVLFIPVAVGASSSTRLDNSWKKYTNKQAGYCISYPGRWRRGDAFDGAGIWVEAGAKKFSVPLGEMDVSVAVEPAVRTAEYLQLHLDGLKKFERAQKVEMLETRDIDLPGSSGLLAKARYFDPQDRALWIDEVVLATHADKLYRMELECRADHLPRFERMFTRFVESFRWNCNAK